MSRHIIFAEKPRKDVVPTKVEKTVDQSVLENYLTDESALIRGYAEEVVFPKSEEQVAGILKEANERNVRVTVSGAGTGITGARVPLGGIVLSTEKMINVYESGSEGLIEHFEPNARYTLYLREDAENNEFYAVAPPGIPLEVFKKIVEAEGLYYPPDPTETTALLGATVATNASGARTFSYGCTRDYVRRIRVVLPNGDVLDVKRGEVTADEENKFSIVFTSRREVTIRLPTYTMPKVRKNAAGYYSKPKMDLIDLFIGSEGTLGVISEVEVRLTGKPKRVFPVFAHFPSEADSLRFVQKLRELSLESGKEKRKMRVLSIEFFDRNSVEFLRERYSLQKIPEKSQAIVFFEEEILDEEATMELLGQCATVLESCNVLETKVSLEPNWEREAKEIRHALPEQINSFVRSAGTHKVATDIVVPDEALDEMMSHYHRVGRETGVPYVMFGHIGDNHVHFNFLPRNREELGRAVRACTQLLKKAVQLGGTISGEHGVGKKAYVENGERKPYLEVMYGRDGLMSMAKIKHTLDPNHILNIGNIVPAEYLESLAEKPD